MGHAQGSSMLYLEARCLAVDPRGRLAGRAERRRSPASRSRSRVPGGTREILAENLIAAWLDLEVASGNDAIASHSPIRKTAKLMGQFLPGTDFVTSGYSVMPRHDNMFGGGNYDADDLDEWLTLQRDWQVDAGHRAGRRGGACLRVRERAARAIQAVFDGLGFPPVTDEEVEAATYRLRQPRPARPRPRRRRRSPPTACSTSASPALDVAPRARPPRLQRRRRGGARHAAPAGLAPTTSRRPR